MSGGYGDYNNRLGTDYSMFKLGTTDGNNKQVANKPGYIDLHNVKTEASELSKMNPADVMAYLNNLGNDMKLALGKELLGMVTDTQMKADIQKMLDLLPKETAQKVAQFTTQKAIDSISRGYETTILPGMQLVEDGAIAANLTSFPEGDVLGSEFSKMFQAIA